MYHSNAFVKIYLTYEIFNIQVLLGLIVSVGGLTERLVRSSSQSLFGLLENMDTEAITNFCDIILNIFSSYQKVCNHNIKCHRRDQGGITLLFFPLL